MRKTRLRKNNGITLIALVITIIVLLILAGVAISMLSGENGILNKAKEAKEKTEKGQEDDLGKLLGYELVLNNTKYKYQNGYITGFTYDFEEEKIEDSVNDLESKLPSGYEVSLKYNPQTKKDDEIKDKSTKVTTGMAITKNGKEVARTVIFGDVNCDGSVVQNDELEIIAYCNFMSSVINKDFQKVASNLCSDDELNYDDINVMNQFFNGDVDEIQDTVIRIIPTKRVYKELQEYISLLDNSKGYSFEYNSDKDEYKLKIKNADITVSALINDLPKSDEIEIIKNETESVSGSEKVIDGYYLKKQLKDKNGAATLAPRFAYIEIEK